MAELVEDTFGGLRDVGMELANGMRLHDLDYADNVI